MSDTAATPGGSEAVVTRAELGWRLIHWGLGLFTTGFLTGVIPILHYMHGALAGDVGPAFLKNTTMDTSAENHHRSCSGSGIGAG